MILRTLSIFLILIVGLGSVRGNQRVFETIITVDADGTIGQQVGYTTMPEFYWLTMQGLNGKSLVRHGDMIYQVFIVSRYIYIRQTTDGIHWSKPVRVNNADSYVYSSGGGSLNPCALGFARNGSEFNLVVSWVVDSGSIKNIVTVTSVDSGKTFSSPQSIYIHKNSLCQYMSMAEDTNGGLYLLWSSASSTDAAMTTVWSTKTTNGGSSWRLPTSNIYAANDDNNRARYVDGASCDGLGITVFSPGHELNFYRLNADGIKTDHIKKAFPTDERIRYSQLVRDSDCVLHAFYTTFVKNSYSIKLNHVSSTDNGKTWHDSSLVVGAERNTVFSGEEEGRPSFAFGQSGNIYVLFVADRKLYLVISSDKGKTWQKRKEIINGDSNQFVTNNTPSLAYIGSNGSADSLLIVWEDYRELAGVRQPDVSASSLQIYVYPNPVRTTMTIAITVSAERSISIDLMNPLGVIVRNVRQKYSSGVNTTTMNIEGLPAGVYMLSLLTDNGEKLAQTVVIN